MGVFDVWWTGGGRVVGVLDVWWTDVRWLCAITRAVLAYVKRFSHVVVIVCMCVYVCVCVCMYARGARV